MSWYDAKHYIDWLNSTNASQKTGYKFRLPSDAEWEYAAKAGADELNFWGSSSSNQCKYANGRDVSSEKSMYGEKSKDAPCDDGYDRTSPVGHFLPNSWGLYDFLGNVKQWTQDCWASTPAEVLADGPARIFDGDCSSRVVRGSSWAYVSNAMLISNRFFNQPEDRNDGTGFRLAADIVAN